MVSVRKQNRTTSLKQKHVTKQNAAWWVIKFARPVQHEYLQISSSIFDPLSLPTVKAWSDHYFHTWFQNLNFKVKIVIATSGTGVLAEGIINDTCLFFNYQVTATPETPVLFQPLRPMSLMTCMKLCSNSSPFSASISPMNFSPSASLTLVRKNFIIYFSKPRHFRVPGTS